MTFMFSLFQIVIQVHPPPLHLPRKPHTCAPSDSPLGHHILLNRHLLHSRLPAIPSRHHRRRIAHRCLHWLRVHDDVELLGHVARRTGACAVVLGACCSAQLEAEGYGQRFGVDRLCAIRYVLPQVRSPAAAPRASLQGMRRVRAAHGPPLPVGGQLRGAQEHKELHALPHVCHLLHRTVPLGRGAAGDANGPQPQRPAHRLCCCLRRQLHLHRLPRLHDHHPLCNHFQACARKSHVTRGHERAHHEAAVERERAQLPPPIRFGFNDGQFERACRPLPRARAASTVLRHE